MAGGQPAPLRSSEQAALRLGRRFFERGHNEAALEHLERVVRARPDFADVHYMLGMLYERRGDLEGAARSLSEALRINPHYAEARLALLSVYEQRGDYAHSEEIANAAPTGQVDDSRPLDRTTDAKLANLQAALGDAYREVGELRDAAEAYRKALARCPSFTTSGTAWRSRSVRPGSRPKRSANSNARCGSSPTGRRRECSSA